MCLATKDCVNWLVEMIMANPKIVTSHYVEQEEKKQVYQLAINAKNWKRTFKFGVNSNHDYAKNAYKIAAVGSDYSNWGEPLVHYLIDKANINWIRAFELKPTDGGIVFMVLEDTQENLHLGEFLGD